MTFGQRLGCRNVKQGGKVVGAIGIIGLKNIAVIKSGNGFLVCALEDEQKVKDLTQILPGEYL